MAAVSSAYASAVLAASVTLALSLASASAQKQAAPPASTAPSTADFTAEISLGKTFSQEIGRGLLFQLVPTPGDPGSGWNIQIVPKDPSQAVRPGPDDNISTDFAGIATPPYHGYNPLYLDTSYATKASEAVAQTPRKFYFVESAADYKAALNSVNLAIYPNKATTKQLSEAKDASAKTHLGSGQLDILDSKLAPGAGSNDTGSIQWMKFRVQIKLDTDMTMAKILESSGEGGK